MDDEGLEFVHLARSIYRAANFGSVLNAFAMHVLSELFSTLQEDALLLLAGLWSTAPNSDAKGFSHAMISGSDLQLVALSHAKAYLRAHSRTPGKLNDFQTVLPSLILPLRSLDQRVRVAAIECAREMYYPPAALQNRTNADIFAYDRLYGSHSGESLIRTSDSFLDLKTPSKARSNTWISLNTRNTFSCCVIGRNISTLTPTILALFIGNSFTK